MHAVKNLEDVTKFFPNIESMLMYLTILAKFSQVCQRVISLVKLTILATFRLPEL